MSNLRTPELTRSIKDALNKLDFLAVNKNKVAEDKQESFMESVQALTMQFYALVDKNPTQAMTLFNDTYPTLLKAIPKSAYEFSDAEKREQAIRDGREAIKSQIADLNRIIKDAEMRDNIVLAKSAAAAGNEMVMVYNSLTTANTAQEARDRVARVMEGPLADVNKLIASQTIHIKESREYATDKLKNIEDEIEKVKSEMENLEEPAKSRSEVLQGQINEMIQISLSLRENIAVARTDEIFLKLNDQMNNLRNLYLYTAQKELQKISRNRPEQELQLQKAVNELQQKIIAMDVVALDAENKSQDIYNKLKGYKAQAEASINDVRSGKKNVIENLNAIQAITSKVEHAIEVAKKGLTKLKARPPEQVQISAFSSKSVRQREKIMAVYEFLNTHKNKMTENGFFDRKPKLPAPIGALERFFDGLQKEATSQNITMAQLLSQRNATALDGQWKRIEAAAKEHTSSKNQDVKTLISAIKDNNVKKLKPEKPKEERKVMKFP